MGGKGRKRREKNYLAAHGGQAARRLPPTPAASSIEALPFKLRQIMTFTRSSQPGSVEVSVDTAQRNKGDTGASGDGIEKKFHSDEKLELNNSGVKRKGHDDIEKDSTHENKKKKWRRKGVDDLRFETGELTGVGSKRKERKKKRLEEMKKKHKKVKAEDNLDFPEREVIKFGEVVEAPPKLISIPKGKKSAKMLQKRGFVWRQLMPTGIGEDGHQGQGSSSLHLKLHLNHFSWYHSVVPTVSTCPMLICWYLITSKGL